MKIALIASTFLLATTEVIPSSLIDPVSRLGAVSVLGVVLIGLVFKTIPAMSRDQKEALDNLNETLGDMKRMIFDAVNRK